MQLPFSPHLISLQLSSGQPLLKDSVERISVMACVNNRLLGAGAMAPRPSAALAEGAGQFSAPPWWLTAICNANPRNPGTLFWHQTGAQHACLPVGKTLTHSNIFKKFVLLFAY